MTGRHRVIGDTARARMLDSDPVNMARVVVEEDDDEVEGDGRKEGGGRNERTDEIEAWSMEMDREKGDSVL